MPDTGLKNSPLLIKGALVQMIEDIIGIIPNVIPFQYNPTLLTYQLEPWNPFEVDQTQRGCQAPNVQPFDPKESFTLELELDAADDLENGDVVTVLVGVADRLAALKKLVLPTQGLLGDLVASAKALVGDASARAERPTVPVSFFIWGPGRILPVRVTSFSVEETLFSPTSVSRCRRQCRWDWKCSRRTFSSARARSAPTWPWPPTTSPSCRKMPSPSPTSRRPPNRSPACCPSDHDHGHL